jgi:hypothetical protein
LFAAQASRKAVVPKILLRETQKQRRSLRLRTSAKTFPSCWTNLRQPPRTGATVFFSYPCPIHSGSGPETSYQRFTARRRTSPVRRHFAATRRSLSRANLLKPRSLPARGRRTRIHSSPAGTLPKRVETRPRFRRCLVPGTTRKHANEAATALQRTSLDSHPLLLAGHSQTGLFKHQGDLFPGTGSTTPGRHSPSQLSDDLRPADHVPRGRYPSGLAPYVPGSRLGIVSAMLAISGDRTQKHPLTPRCRLFAIRRRLRLDSLASPSRRAFRG